MKDVEHSKLPVSRRTLLRNAALAVAAQQLAACSLIQGNNSEPFDYILVVEPYPITLIDDTTTPAWTFNRQYPAPILRLKQHQPVRIKVINKLAEPTTIHWHGIRLNNAADGVPYLTQEPIAPEQSFTYEFTPPDAGTFWYHPHMNSLEQLSRGLVGMIIVEEDTPVAFAADLPLILKDWHLHPDGSFSAFSDPRAAARTGTLGNFATVNGFHSATYDLPAGSWVRLRLANMDNTRVFNIACDHPAMVMAVEGNPIAQPYPLKHHPLGAGMRLDLALKMPATLKETVKILDQKGRFGFDICTLVSQHSDQERIEERPKLPLNPVPPIDLKRARTIPLVFEWAGALSPSYGKDKAKDDISMSVFWTINKRAWHSHSGDDLPEPIATIDQGEHIVFELYNATPHHHPIHLHGHTFTVLSSDQRTVEPYHTDTVLMQKYERVQVALVADNPGNWMFHCHVIEHMKTGLMGYIRVNPAD